MYAKVKNIKVGTRIDDGEWHDAFVEEMAEFIGDEIKIEQKPNTKDWFDALGYINCYNYHRSWLEILEEDETL